ncbi:MAG TPA: hypothetical protein VNT24_12135, partial [Propionibacteriaceae bacterium]|nr:hypothetical protein [Propionibacteriaceae bacterium]
EDRQRRHQYQTLRLLRPTQHASARPHAKKIPEPGPSVSMPTARTPRHSGGFMLLNSLSETRATRAASHVSFVSQPDAATQLILQAVEDTSRRQP